MQRVMDEDDMKTPWCNDVVPGTFVVPSEIIPDAQCMQHVTREGCEWRSVEQGDVLLVIATRPESYELVLLHMRCQKVIITNDVTFKWVTSINQ